ncbi:MAG: hypothetical protein BWY56_02098 [Acidobacteria bacterium ADurb.Bin340]|nr:MAG: hypothetical protein BWY56_02098 [Acidobacteria bacterium ADurb.Bin340]
MSDAPVVPQLKAPLRRMAALRAAWKPILLNWLLPGAGYWLIGEKRRAQVLAAVWAVFLIIGYFQLAGGAEGGVRGGIYVPQTEPFAWMPTLGAVATLGVGPVYGLFAWAFGGAGTEPVRNLTQEYGATYLMVAGLMNWLVCFDLFDRITGRWVWRLPKDEREALAEAAKQAGKDS